MYKTIESKPLTTEATGKLKNLNEITSNQLGGGMHSLNIIFIPLNDFPFARNTNAEKMFHLTMPCSKVWKSRKMKQPQNKLRFACSHWKHAYTQHKYHHTDIKSAICNSKTKSLRNDDGWWWCCCCCCYCFCWGAQIFLVLNMVYCSTR